VCYPQLLARRFEKLGLGDILKRHRSNGIRWTRLNEIENKAVMLIRPGFIWDIKKFLDLIKTEQRFWDSGIHSWNNFTQNCPIRLPQSKINFISKYLQGSYQHIESN